ncbi:hypothetical protein RN001_010835 [Aquatica leii]|uniref:Uncharacterized protein n=1 Tax=Aquatica leii TaxID=1421715 RepID=A0AAN7PVA7_9COLE|nr:hypothetical protein RN001_010835 [Aquatica leii]
MLNYKLMVIVLSAFLFKFIPANKTTISNSTLSKNYTGNWTGLNISKNANTTKNVTTSTGLFLDASFCRTYIGNFSRVKMECLYETMASLNYTMSVADTIDLLERSFYIRRNQKDVRCWCGCVCKKMLLLNETNAVVDDQLEIFARVLVNDSHTEDEIDEDCSDLELTLKGLDYCDMGFKLYICVLDQIYDYD